ncbi:MAG: dephospho-CoA kinase [Solirubrobacteraceae bacterium]
MTVPFVGLTGGLGAGKSAALDALATLGAAVVSSDAVVHELYATDAVRDAVRARFGEDVFEGEAVDRGALARRAFARDEDRGWLEALLWPLVAERVEAFRAEASERQPPPAAVVVEVPLLFEAAIEARYDTTIAIVADDALRAARLALRDQEELGRREARQLPQEEKARRARFVVVNDGTLDELRDELRSVLTRLAP